MNYIFMFPGQGTQRPGMIKALHPMTESMHEIFNVAKSVTGRDIEAICKSAGDIELMQTENTQLAVTAMNLAYYIMLLDVGITPDVVLGHSLGQFSAIYASGMCSLQDIFSLVNYRSMLMSRVNCDGCLCTIIGMNIADVYSVCSEIDPEHERLTVALYNGKTQIVVGGFTEDIERAIPLFNLHGAIGIRKVHVTKPFHTPLLRTVEKKFSEYIEGISFKSPNCKLMLNCKGGYADCVDDVKKDLIMQCSHMVKWYDCIQEISSMNAPIVLEVGMGRTLINTLKNSGISVSSYQISDKKQFNALLAKLKGDS